MVRPDLEESLHVKTYAYLQYAKISYHLSKRRGTVIHDYALRAENQEKVNQVHCLGYSLAEERAFPMNAFGHLESLSAVTFNCFHVHLNHLRLPKLIDQRRKVGLEFR